ncbi:SPOR domain-containing protein [Gynuella sunshinyii]|uniref:SPOR domain-containing protein n=1 Tax=Gynuella sunshinyii YC6258 TaxID=1445510 RepID=A0A0C5VTU1_9GAMM|nr:SPOR domain-containing protein [Gynuella sunshinyii]AJQ97606.1 hypothetical Protein YC6258_05578 [Gynuella sunshinyii YC6258]
MKWIFFVLLFLNVVLFGWSFLKAPADKDVSPSASNLSPAQINNIKLLGSETAKSIATSLQTGATECVQLGPFSSDSIASQVILRLGALDMPSRQETLKQSAVKDYLVYLPPFKSLSEAKAKLNELNQRGIDSYVFGSGDLANGLSLGVYSKKNNAEAIYSKIKALGYKPIIKENTVDSSAIWVVINADGSKYFNEGILESLQSNFPEINSRLITCN